MSLAVLSRGTLLKRKISGVFTTIPEAGDVSFPGSTREEIDVTTQDSPGQTKEFLGGDIDFGEIAQDMNFVPTNAVHAVLVADSLSASVVQEWQISYAAGTKTCSFSGYVKGYAITGPVNGVYKATLTIRCTGLPVYA